MKEQDLPREMLYIADELFFTGTAAEITPIRSVDRDPDRTGPPRSGHDRLAEGVLRLRQRRRAGPSQLADAGRDSGAPGRGDSRWSEVVEPSPSGTPYSAGLAMLSRRELSRAELTAKLIDRGFTREDGRRRGRTPR